MGWFGFGKKEKTPEKTPDINSYVAGVRRRIESANTVEELQEIASDIEEKHSLYNENDRTFLYGVANDCNEKINSLKSVSENINYRQNTTNNAIIKTVQSESDLPHNHDGALALKATHIEAIKLAKQMHNIENEQVKVNELDKTIKEYEHPTIPLSPEQEMAKILKEIEDAKKILEESQKREAAMKASTKK